MTEATLDQPKGWSVKVAPIIFGATVFASAALIFLVEPMIAKLVLPTLGGSPMVWNTCMAFFQAALLIGYLYAHLLQRVKSLKKQVLIHIGVLIVALAVMPLRVTELLGEPSSTMPGLWLLGVLALSLGPPFAALSATAPLAQAWYARLRAGEADAVNPYVLYAASNLGSLIALVAYPVIVEPTLTLKVQTIGWSLGYGAFILLMAGSAYLASRRAGGGEATPTLSRTGPAITWRDRLIWMGLAAIPSSLMLGVTTHITTDIASTPFLWVAPLALYLITFIIAFQDKPLFSRDYVLLIQGAFLVATCATLGLPIKYLGAQMAVHLIGFFMTALVCHQALAASRPDPSRLTEFYLAISVGGVIGGAFNAFVAPTMFPGVWEYPIALALAGLARPWPKGGLQNWERILFALGGVAIALALAFHLHNDLAILVFKIGPIPLLAFAVAVVCTYLMRDRAPFFAVMLALVVIASINLGRRENVIHTDRSFFGVLRVSSMPVPGYTGKLNMLAHGTTLHGAQPQEPNLRCTPTTYYEAGTPIGQVFRMKQAIKPQLTVGAVGMGTGTVAAFSRKGDVMRFFEIDQDVIDMSTSPNYFSYIPICAQGKVDWKVGDARLTLGKEPLGKYDILLIDAFSSDAVPAHLLTVEAMKEYLARLKPDGVVIMHLSNRRLELMQPVAAVAKAAGGFALAQGYNPSPDLPVLASASEEAIIVGKTRQALHPFEMDGRWTVAQTGGVAPWTDDYTNLFGAMMRKF